MDRVIAQSEKQSNELYWAYGSEYCPIYEAAYDISFIFCDEDELLFSDDLGTFVPPISSHIGFSRRKRREEIF